MILLMFLLSGRLDSAGAQLEEDGTAVVTLFPYGLVDKNVSAPINLQLQRCSQMLTSLRGNGGWRGRIILYAQEGFASEQLQIMLGQFYNTQKSIYKSFLPNNQLVSVVELDRATSDTLKGRISGYSHHHQSRLLPLVATKHLLGLLPDKVQRIMIVSEQVLFGAPMTHTLLTDDHDANGGRYSIVLYRGLLGFTPSCFIMSRDTSRECIQNFIRVALETPVPAKADYMVTGERRSSAALQRTANPHRHICADAQLGRDNDFLEPRKIDVYFRKMAPIMEISYAFVASVLGDNVNNKRWERYLEGGHHIARPTDLEFEMENSAVEEQSRLQRRSQKGVPSNASLSRASECAPHIVVAGVAKCATTSLHEILVQHPQVLPPYVKEPNYTFKTPQDSNGQWYLDQLVRAKKTMSDAQRNLPYLTIDSSSHIFWQRETLKNLVKFCPSTRMIVILCNPIKRAISHWNYRKYIWEWDFLVNKTFDETVSRQLQEIPQWIHIHPRPKNEYLDLDTDDSEGVWTLLREGLYDLGLQQLGDVFPRDQLLVVNRDELQHNPRELLKKVQHFLGLEYYEYPEQTFVRRKNMNSRKDPVSKETMALLKQFYRPHIAKLGHMLSWNLSTWYD